jgi:two-component system LytT family response regulator
MTIRCICIDDEPLARQGLKLALQPFTNFELVAQYGAADEYLKEVEANLAPETDVLFVDIEMPRMNGFELIEQLTSKLPIIIFVTAYDQYAIKAFEQQALDYILKPILEDRFSQVVARIEKTIQQPKAIGETEYLKKKISILKQQITLDEATLSIKTDEGYFRVKVADILFIESVGDHVCIHLSQSQLITRNTLKFYVTELSEHGFHQIHKSSLVNIKHVASIKKLRFADYQMTMTNKKELKVSRRYKSVMDFI